VGALNRVPWFEEDGRELFEAACGLDLEGIVAKRKADPYGPKTAWYKIRNSTYTQAEGRHVRLSRCLNAPWFLWCSGVCLWRWTKVPCSTN
jgi:hypothetical protein